MTRQSPVFRPLALALVTSALALPASAQTDPASPTAQDPAPTSRESMWPAPTAEQWAKPCLVHWERTFEDAIAVSRETDQAILICVNMDGEPASEHYAGVRYREPDKAALYEPYVCVIASVYRHSDRDYDEEGNRIPCPRFGGVTCGEHIAIEPLLFGQYFEGERVAPRHIMIELDKSEVYDVYYALDTDSVFRAIREGIENREIEAHPIERSDRPLLDRVDSRASEDQLAVEAAFREGDRETRRALLEAALEAGDDAPVDMLRLAVFGFDVEHARMARRVLTRSLSVRSLDLIGEALRVPMEPEEREALIVALERIGATAPRARTLAAVHRGLDSRSSAFDEEDWSRALADSGSATSAVDRSVLEARLQYQDDSLESADARLDLAESLLARAFDPRQAGAARRADEEYTRFLLEDAYRSVLEAERLGASGWRLDAVVALATYYQDELEAAAERAELAVGAMPSGESSWTAMAVLELFAKSRWGRIVAAVTAKEEWPRQWLTDVNSSCSVLARHPLGTDGQVAWHYDILEYLKAMGQATSVLEAGLARFPASAELHLRLRGSIMRERGVDGLEAAYEARLAAEGATPTLEWFAGYASMITAEVHRRRTDEAAASAAYDRCIAHFEAGSAADPELLESAEHYVALALAGRARLALEAGDYERAAEWLLSSFARREDSAATLDGLGLSAVATGKTLVARATEAGRDELAATIQGALDGLDPVLLLPPPFEPRGPDGRPSADARRFRGGRRGNGR